MSPGRQTKPLERERYHGPTGRARARSHWTRSRRFRTDASRCTSDR